MALEILVIGRGGVGRGEDREEFRHEIDEHDAAGPNLGTGPAGDKRAPGPKACGPGRDALTTLSGVVAHLAAHLGEEPPLGGGETVDAARRDLVEHAVDLRLRAVPLDAARRLRRVAGPRGAPWMDQHAGLGPASEVALGSSQAPVAG